MTPMASQRPSPEDRLSSLGRGIFALKSFEPCRRPGEVESATRSSTSRGSETIQKKEDQPQSTDKPNGLTSQKPKTAISAVNQVNQTSNNSSQTNFDTAKATELFAKYNYKANPDRPGGFDELSFKQSERLWLIKHHPTNEHWLQARNEHGGIGYVPTSYVQIIEKQITDLPWLQKKATDYKCETEEKASNSNQVSVFGKPPPNVVAKQPIKAYIPSYSANAKVTDGPSNAQFYCAICDKQLNGPLPYKAHMISKYHKEEEEAQRLYGS